MDEIVSSYPRRYTEKFSPGRVGSTCVLIRLYKTFEGRSPSQRKKSKMKQITLFTRNNINASV